MPIFYRTSILVLRAGLLVAIVASPMAFAQSSLSYNQAKQILRQNSDAIKASQFDIDSKQNTAESLEGLNFPTLSIEAGVQAYSLDRGFDIDPLREAVGDLIPGAEQFVRSTIDFKFGDTNPQAALISTWTLYAGDRINASQRAAKAFVDEAKAMRDLTLDEQEKLLATVYFGHLLAKSALNIRTQVRDDIQRHLHQAIRFEETGVISRVERLHAQVAFDEAQRNLEQAKSDYGIAKASLQRLLRYPQSIDPITQLFVITEELAPLSSFIKAGLENHSELQVIRAKGEQAKQGKEIEEGRWKPTVVAYGSYNLAQQNANFSDPLPLLEPDWIVGVNVSYKLFDSVNRSSAVNAADLQVQRVNALEREFEMRLSTFIEQSYRSVQRARNQFLLLESNIELAKETLILRERMFAEGIGTSLDVVDARVSAAKAETERAAAAYDFVMSLVNLLQASGQLQHFNDYLLQADVRLNKEDSVK
jgi:outer membrane protein TolC